MQPLLPQCGPDDEDNAALARDEGNAGMTEFGPPAADLQRAVAEAAAALAAANPAASALALAAAMAVRSAIYNALAMVVAVTAKDKFLIPAADELAIPSTAKAFAMALGRCQMFSLRRTTATAEFDSAFNFTQNLAKDLASCVSKCSATDVATAMDEILNLSAAESKHDRAVAKERAHLAAASAVHLAINHVLFDVVIDYSIFLRTGHIPLPPDNIAAFAVALASAEFHSAFVLASNIAWDTAQRVANIMSAAKDESAEVESAEAASGESAEDKAAEDESLENESAEDESAEDESAEDKSDVDESVEDDLLIPAANAGEDDGAFANAWTNAVAKALAVGVKAKGELEEAAPWHKDEFADVVGKHLTRAGSSRVSWLTRIREKRRHFMSRMPLIDLMRRRLVGLYAPFTARKSRRTELLPP